MTHPISSAMTPGHRTPSSWRDHVRRALAWLAPPLVVAGALILLAATAAQATCQNPPCVPDPQDPGGGGGLVPLTAVSTVDAVLEVSLCLKNPAFATTESTIVAQLKESFARYFPFVDVQAVCTTDKTRERFGVWTTGTLSEPARRGELAGRATILRAGENFAVLFTDGIVQEATDAAWAQQPKTIVDVESFQPFGFSNEDHLQSIEPVTLAAPNKVFNVIHGYVDAEISGVYEPLDFTSTTTDTIGVAKMVPTCSSSTFTQIEDPAPDQECPSPAEPGKHCLGASAGCPFIDGLPVSVPVTKGKKIPLNYLRASVSSAGIAAGAAFGDEVDRTPSAIILGKRILTVDVGDQTAQDFFSVQVSDMVPPLVIAWKVANGSASPVGGMSTTATFNLPSPVPPVMSRAVSVTVTDADGLSIPPTSVNVQIQRDPCSVHNPHVPNCDP